MLFSDLSKLTLAKAVLLKDSPVYVQFYITARCNLTCNQCNIIYANAVRFNGSNNNRLLIINNTANNPSGQIIQIDTDTDVYFSHVKFITADNSLLLGTQSGKIYKVC